MSEVKIVINAIHFSQRTRLTGIQRVFRELVFRLDKLCEKKSNIIIEYAYPQNAKNLLLNIANFKNIKPLPLPNKSNKILQAITLPRYLKKEHAMCLCIEIENGFFSKRHISFIHDLRPVEFKTDPLIFRLKYKIFLMIEKIFSKRLITVSQYQKYKIIKYLKYNKNKINVIYPGWEHMLDIYPDNGIFAKFPKIEKNSYFFSLGSIAPHKNLKWILELAERNKTNVFVIAGLKDLSQWENAYSQINARELDNVIFVGYTTDEENKALMMNCKAFLHPSKYEGFGIPPLEALACGAPIAVSNSSCLPEIYENCAHYFDPDDYEVDLNWLLEQPISAPSTILQKCSWDRAAQELFNILENYE